MVRPRGQRQRAGGAERAQPPPAAPCSVAMEDASGAGKTDARAKSKRRRVSPGEEVGGGARMLFGGGEASPGVHVRELFADEDDQGAGGGAAGTRGQDFNGGTLFADACASGAEGGAQGGGAAGGEMDLSMLGGMPAASCWSCVDVAPFHFPDEAPSEAVCGADLPRVPAMVRVATYNVWMEQATGHRTARVVETLRCAAPDVVALQELTQGMLKHMREDHPDFWATYPHRLLQPPAERLQQWEPDYFCGILSRWPLARPSGVEVGGGGGGGGAWLEFRSNMDRGLLWAVVRVPRARPLVVGTSHFESVHSGDLCWGLRCEQLTRSAVALRTASEGVGGAAVLLGDFNWVSSASGVAERDMDTVLASADASLPLLVERSPWKDAWLQAGGSDADGATFDPARNALIPHRERQHPAQRLDRVMVAGAEANVVGAELIGLPAAGRAHAPVVVAGEVYRTPPDRFADSATAAADDGSEPCTPPCATPTTPADADMCTPPKSDAAAFAEEAVPMSVARPEAPSDHFGVCVELAFEA